MSQIQIKIEQDADLLKLVKSLGSRNRSEFDAAMEAVAAYVGDVILEVVEQAPVISNLFTTVTYNEGSAPSLPLDVYYDVKDKNYLQVWTQSIPGGLASNFVHGLNELMVACYDIMSAVSMHKRYAREARLDVLAATIERMIQEFLVVRETNAANVLFAAAGQARFGPGNTPQVIRSATANVFQMDDFNRIITLLQRIRPSWVGGTPVGGNTVSHLIGSPEFHEQLRSIAYQPQNTRAGSIGGTETSNTSISASDKVRDSVFSAAGNPSFFGVELVNVYEMGIGQPYNQLFANYIGATTFQGYGGGAAAAFTPASEEVVLALSLNSNRRALTRLVERNQETGTTLVVRPDDSFPMRSDKIGFYGAIREGVVSLDSRHISALVW